MGQLEPPEVPKAHSEAPTLPPFLASTAELTSPSGRQGACGFPLCLREGLSSLMGTVVLTIGHHVTLGYYFFNAIR